MPRREIGLDLYLRPEMLRHALSAPQLDPMHVELWECHGVIIARCGSDTRQAY